MTIKAIATATNLKDEGFINFERSLKKFNWDYDIISSNYVAYGSKMKNAYNYALNTKASHLFILDAYDVIVLDTMENAIDKLPNNCVMFNAEKGCWPWSDWAKEYPYVPHAWKYLNGGAAFVNVEKFIQLFEDNPIKDKDNDQEVLGRVYLDKRDQYNILLDTGCTVFQSIAFRSDGDFSYIDNRLYNNKTNTCPIIIHGNGRTSMNKIVSLL